MNLTKIKYLLPTIIIAIAIFLVSHQPNLQLPETGIDFFDKLLHIIAYLIFGITINYAIVGLKPGIETRKAFIILLVVGSVYAFSDELHQYYVPGRDADIIDFLADLVGILLSFFFYGLLSKILKTGRVTNV